MTDRPIDERGLPEGWPLDAEREITPRELKAALEADRVLLIDIREPDELAAASIDHHLHIPMGDLPSRLNELDAEEDTPIALLCHSGRRSLSATVFLHQQGFNGARSVAGGIDLWSVDIDPSVPRY